VSPPPGIQGPRSPLSFSTRTVSTWTDRIRDEFTKVRLLFDVKTNKSGLDYAGKKVLATEQMRAMRKHCRACNARFDELVRGVPRSQAEADNRVDAYVLRDHEEEGHERAD
jgi:hypothetical protein